MADLVILGFVFVSFLCTSWKYKTVTYTFISSDVVEADFLPDFFNMYIDGSLTNDHFITPTWLKISSLEKTLLGRELKK